MKYEQEVRELLISNTIRLIAEGGFEKATTKAITHSGNGMPGIKMNEVYIYRLFGSKETLYAAVFMQLDQELYIAFKNAVEAVGGFDSFSKEKMYQFFLTAWKYILGNEIRCRCYVRYYYSVYFKDQSLEEHGKHFELIANEMNSLFREEADVIAILRSVFTSLFDFAIRVYNGELKDNDINRPHIFNVLYCMMATYFKEEFKIESPVSQFI